MNGGMHHVALCTGGFEAAIAAEPIAAMVCYHHQMATSAHLDLSRSKDWVYQAARKLEVIGRLKHDWDSYGGAPLKEEAREFTVQALRWLGQDDLPIPGVVLESDGTVQLEWRAKGKELEVDLGAGDKIEYVSVDEDGRIVEGVERDSLLQTLRRLTGWFMES